MGCGLEVQTLANPAPLEAPRLKRQWAGTVFANKTNSCWPMLVVQPLLRASVRRSWHTPSLLVIGPALPVTKADFVILKAFSLRKSAWRDGIGLQSSRGLCCPWPWESMALGFPYGLSCPSVCLQPHSCTFPTCGQAACLNIAGCSCFPARSLHVKCLCQADNALLTLLCVEDVLSRVQSGLVFRCCSCPLAMPVVLALSIACCDTGTAATRMSPAFAWKRVKVDKGFGPAKNGPTFCAPVDLRAVMHLGSTSFCPPTRHTRHRGTCAIEVHPPDKAAVFRPHGAPDM